MSDVWNGIDRDKIQDIRKNGMEIGVDIEVTLAAPEIAWLEAKAQELSAVYPGTTISDLIIYIVERHLDSMAVEDQSLSGYQPRDPL